MSKRSKSQIKVKKKLKRLSPYLISNKMVKCACQKEINPDLHVACHICKDAYCSIECLVNSRVAHSRICNTIPQKMVKATQIHRDLFSKALEEFRSMDESVVSFVILQGNKEIEEWLKRPCVRPISQERARIILEKLRKQSGANLPLDPPLSSFWVEYEEKGVKKIKYIC
jgi:hypothetical protein